MDGPDPQDQLLEYDFRYEWFVTFYEFYPWTYGI